MGKYSCVLVLENHIESLAIAYAGTVAMPPHTWLLSLSRQFRQHMRWCASTCCSTHCHTACMYIKNLVTINVMFSFTARHQLGKCNVKQQRTTENGPAYSKFASPTTFYHCNCALAIIRYISLKLTVLDTGIA